MVNIEKIPVSTPEMDETSSQQEEAITQLLATVKKENGDDSFPFLFAREEDEEGRRFIAYKFLKARKWKLSAALTMVRETLAFRKENKLDEWRLFPCAFPLLGFDEQDILATVSHASHPIDGRKTPNTWDMVYRALQSSYVNVYHYCDKDGHPVMYDCCGHADVSDILKRVDTAIPVGKQMKDVIVPYHTYMNEVQYYMIRYADAVAKRAAQKDAPGTQTDKKITGITVVLNAEGMHIGMIQKQFIDIVQAIFTVDQKYYPEVLHRLFVVNCPLIVKTAYAFVKSSLDSSTQEKVVFCSKAETLEVLRRVIDDDRIPAELGGSCHCAGGCLPKYVDPEAQQKKTDSVRRLRANVSEVEAPTEKITLKAGKTVERLVELRSGETVHWDFSMNGSDVHFSAAFEASTTDSTQDESKSDAVSVHGELPSTDDSQDMWSPSAGTSSPPVQRNATGGHAIVPAVPVEVRAREKMADSHDQYTAEQDGVLHLLWDNKSSWLAQKNLQLRVFGEDQGASPVQ